MQNLELSANKPNKMEALENSQLRDINGGIFGWDDFALGVALYVTIEVIDGVARYANGERKR